LVVFVLAAFKNKFKRISFKEDIFNLKRTKSFVYVRNILDKKKHFAPW
jgi:hypothetical protein